MFYMDGIFDLFIILIICYNFFSIDKEALNQFLKTNSKSPNLEIRGGYRGSWIAVEFK